MRNQSGKVVPRLFVANDPTVLRIVPELAAEIGLNESIMLLQIDFMMSNSTTQAKKGRPWAYKSIREMQAEYFPFWSKDTINRTIASLQAKRLIRCDNFNKAAYDRTRWFSLNYAKCNRLKSIRVSGGLYQNATRSAQNATRKTQDATRSMQNRTTIPETTTQTTPETTHNTRHSFALNNIPEGIREAVRYFVENVDKTTNLGKCRIVAENAVAELGAGVVADAILQAAEEAVKAIVEPRFQQRSLFNLLKNHEGIKRRASLYKPPELPEWIRRGGENAIYAVMQHLKYGEEVPKGAEQWIEQAQQRLTQQSIA